MSAGRRTSLRLTGLCDRAFRHPIVLFHLGVDGQEVYFVPILEQLRANRSRIVPYVLVDRIVGTPPRRIARSCCVPLRRVVPVAFGDALGRADAFVSPTQWVRGFEPCADRRICVFHGQPTKGLTFLPELMGVFTDLFLLGPLQQQVFERFKQQYPHIGAAIREHCIGYPKSDALLSGAYQLAEVKQRYTMPDGRPVVLYAPTWDPNGALDGYGLDLVDALLGTGAVVIVKLHYMCYTPAARTGGTSWPDVFSEATRTRPSMRYDHYTTIDELLAICDVLVTDISSAAFECMAVDKPVVFMHCAKFYSDTMGSGQYIVDGQSAIRSLECNAGRDGGVVVNDLTSLHDAVLRAISRPEECASARRQVADALLFNPGCAAPVAARTLEKIVADVSSQRHARHAPPVWRRVAGA